MSTDLEFRQRLPQLRLPGTEPESSQPTSAEQIAAIQTEEADRTDGGDECCTPTSQQHKIPTVLKCPPAPRKQRKAVSCKRKLSELQFFEIVAGEEIDSFFRVSFEMVRAKRRFPFA